MSDSTNGTSPPDQTTLRFCPCCGSDLTQYHIKLPTAQKPARTSKALRLPETIKEEYESGTASVTALAIRYNVDPQTIRKRLHALGADCKQKPKIADMIPEIIATEYPALTLLEIAAKYHRDPSQVRTRLEQLGVKIKKQGWKGTMKSNLTAAKIQDILKRDIAMEPHPSIAKDYGITRERVRQICIQHGNPARRQRVIEAIHQRAVPALEKEAERIAKRQEVSRLWKEGASTEAMNAVMGSEGYARIHSVIALWRKKYPNEFPYRQPTHWKARKAA